MRNKTPHIHAEFLAEAAQDISRQIEGKHDRRDFWEQVTLSFVAGSNFLWEFRFTDTAHNIVSSLTDYELCKIVDKHNHSLDDVNFSVIRAVANAAAAKHDEDSARERAKNLKGEASYQPKSLDDQDPTPPEETASLYKNTKFRIF